MYDTNDYINIYSLTNSDFSLDRNNDNLRALEFYQKRGYCLTKIYPNAIKKVRKLKKDVPLLGINNIPLRDEIELEKQLIRWIKPNNKILLLTTLVND